MARFNFDGTWVEADTYAAARKIYQASKSTGLTVTTATIPVLPKTPTPVKPPSLKPPTSVTPLTTPTLVPEVIVPTVVTSPPLTVGGVKVVLYRGDERKPGELKLNGFQLWGEAIANVSRMGGIGNYLRDACIREKNGTSFADFVRQGKNRGRPTISTAKSDDCGGYGSAFIYKIEFDGLQEYDFDEKIMPPGDPFDWSSRGLKVYMSSSTLQTSRTIVIDLKLATGEWAFCTNIPVKNLTQYKAGKGGDTFKSMADVQATVKKLW